jgi:hypothetical protein
MASGTFTVSAVAYPFEVTSGAVPREQGASISVRHIPGGGDIADKGGKTARRFRLALYFATATAYTNLEGQVNAEGTLQTDADGSTTALLMSLNRTAWHWTGETDAEAEFLVTA